MAQYQVSAILPRDSIFKIFLGTFLSPVKYEPTVGPDLFTLFLFPHRFLGHSLSEIDRITTK